MSSPNPPYAPVRHSHNDRLSPAPFAQDAAAKASSSPASGPAGAAPAAGAGGSIFGGSAGTTSGFASLAAGGATGSFSFGGGGGGAQGAGAAPGGGGFGGFGGFGAAAGGAAGGGLFGSTAPAGGGGLFGSAPPAGGTGTTLFGGFSFPKLDGSAGSGGGLGKPLFAAGGLMGAHGCRAGERGGVGDGSVRPDGRGIQGCGYLQCRYLQCSRTGGSKCTQSEGLANTRHCTLGSGRALRGCLCHRRPDPAWLHACSLSVCVLRTQAASRAVGRRGRGARHVDTLTLIRFDLMLLHK